MTIPPASSPWPRRLLATLGLAAAAAVLSWADPWVFAHVRTDGVYDRDWGRLLRIMGFGPTWLLVALGLWLARRGLGAAARGPALFLVAAVAASGVMGELLKLLVRRGRPGPTDGAYAFIPWDGSWSTGAIGFPSTHAIVAFAGAFAMARLSPRTGPLWILLAAGCGLTRLLDGRHFLTDVAGAAVLAWGITAIVHQAMAPTRLDPA